MRVLDSFTVVVLLLLSLHFFSIFQPFFSHFLATLFGPLSSGVRRIGRPKLASVKNWIALGKSGAVFGHFLDSLGRPKR